jgi:hypothetical protein
MGRSNKPVGFFALDKATKSKDVPGKKMPTIFKEL